MKKVNLKLMLTLLLMILFMIVVPTVSSDYIQTVTNSALIYFIASLGISVMLGMGGQVSFATSAFMGIGAFLSAVLSVKLAVHPLLSAVIAIVITGLLSVVVGLILFRLKGTYFTFASIALTQIMYSIFMNWREVTGGPDGIANIPDLKFGFFETTSKQDYFILISIIAFVSAFIVERMKRTYYGRALSSVRDNEIAAQSLGVNVYRTKVISFIIAAVFAAISGVLIAHSNNYISASLFTYQQSTNYLIMVMLGGVSSVPGTFLGTFLVTMLPEWLRPLLEYIQIIFGISVMILMVFMPMGIAGIVDAIKSKIKIIARKRKVTS